MSGRAEGRPGGRAGRIGRESEALGSCGAGEARGRAALERPVGMGGEGGACLGAGEKGERRAHPAGKGRPGHRGGRLFALEKELKRLRGPTAAGA